MQVSYSHEMIAITIQEDTKTFYFLQNAISKNFSKKIGRKDKIIIFKVEEENIQRKYFLNLISKIYKRKNRNCTVDEIEKIKKSSDKNIKLSLLKSNQILQKIYIDMNIEDNYVVTFQFKTHNSILVSYLKNYFKNHLISYRNKTHKLTIYPDSYKTVELLDKLLEQKEMIGSYIEFNYNLDEYQIYKKHFNERIERKRRFEALFSILEEYYKVLDCKVEDSFETIRKKYLELVKQYHPDRISNSNDTIIKHYTQKFQDIQYAYEMIKTHYTHKKISSQIVA